MAMVKRYVLYLLQYVHFGQAISCPRLLPMQESCTDILSVFHLCIVSTALLPSDDVLSPASAVQDKGKNNAS